MNYRSYRFIDGKTKWIIVDESGKIINKEPSKEELRGLEEAPYIRNKIDKKYNENNTCEFKDQEGKRCTEKLHSKNAQQFDINGKFVWFCKKHGDSYREKLPGSRRNLLKSLRDRRTGKQRPGSSNAKGDLFEELTARWRGVKRLSVEKDNYTLPFDHSVDPELGIIQTKGVFYDTIEQTWHHGDITSEHNKEFDYLIFYCASKDGKIIERIYIFPKKEVVKRTSITIRKNPSKGVQWYEQYRVKEEYVITVITNVNTIWKYIIKLY